MERTVQKVLGEVGEYYATTYLSEMGIRICRADKINWIGHSLLIKNSLKEFDCNNLHPLAQLCEKLLECNVNNRPCKDPNSIFYSFNPSPVTLLNFPNTGDDKFRYYCSINMTYLAILDKCKIVCKNNICPIKSYLRLIIIFTISTITTLRNSIWTTLLNTRSGRNYGMGIRAELIYLDSRMEIIIALK